MKFYSFQFVHNLASFGPGLRLLSALAGFSRASWTFGVSSSIRVSRSIARSCSVFSGGNCCEQSEEKEQKREWQKLHLDSSCFRVETDSESTVLTAYILDKNVLRLSVEYFNILKMYWTFVLQCAEKSFHSAISNCDTACTSLQYLSKSSQGHIADYATNCSTMTHDDSKVKLKGLAALSPGNIAHASDATLKYLLSSALKLNPPWNCIQSHCRALNQNISKFTEANFLGLFLLHRKTQSTDAFYYDLMENVNLAESFRISRFNSHVVSSSTSRQTN